MDADLRNLVRHRADERCEYCRIFQDDEPFLRFHIDHIIPEQHGGQTVAENLALCCHHCNLHKGPNLTGIDPHNDSVTMLYNPRTQRWSDHFKSAGVAIVGITPVGRTTVRVMQMNAIRRLELRSFTSWSPRD